MIDSLQLPVLSPCNLSFIYTVDITMVVKSLNFHVNAPFLMYTKDSIGCLLHSSLFHFWTVNNTCCLCRGQLCHHLVILRRWFSCCNSLSPIPFFLYRSLPIASTWQLLLHPCCGPHLSYDPALLPLFIGHFFLLPSSQIRCITHAVHVSDGVAILMNWPFNGEKMASVEN